MWGCILLLNQVLISCNARWTLVMVGNVRNLQDDVWWWKFLRRKHKKPFTRTINYFTFKISQERPDDGHNMRFSPRSRSFPPPPPSGNRTTANRQTFTTFAVFRAKLFRGTGKVRGAHASFPFSARAPTITPEKLPVTEGLFMLMPRRRRARGNRATDSLSWRGMLPCRMRIFYVGKLTVMVEVWLSSSD